MPENPKLAALLERVQRLTHRRGSKSELAAKLGVKLARLSEWLAGKGSRQPGGEVTLQLLAWVQAEESKQHQIKSPGHVVARPGHKTQIKKPSYEESKLRSKKKN